MEKTNKEYNVFYKVPEEKELEILNDAKGKSYKIDLDELDCSKSFSRRSTDKTFDEIVDIYKKDKDKFFVFIERNRSVHFPKLKDYLEVGLKTDELNKGKSYYIFINMDKKYLKYFVKKYNLVNLILYEKNKRT